MAVYGIGAAAGGAAAVIAQAIKASGVIVRVSPEDFLSIVQRQETPLVVTAGKSLFSPGRKYLVGYKGLAFFCKSSDPLMLPGGAEVIEARTIWIPG